MCENQSRHDILDVRLSKEYWKRFCDNQRHLTSALGIFPLGINREGGFNPDAGLGSAGKLLQFEEKLSV